MEYNKLTLRDKQVWRKPIIIISLLTAVCTVILREHLKWSGELRLYVNHVTCSNH